ncbi:hypothetical protein COX97_01345 [Candidatus Pacearchaeota archaeon CG_4_10_14_0_2_um_filter_05_32_18]|nr:MAG: hypothetical protein COX97_01345 [Candidatus Pacearchaeota archaeon CG_4_10_14_0_2_um_filter_05_32_18]
MIRDYFFLALENLKHRGLRSWLTMLGIFIGIAAVVSLISLGAGLQETITDQFSSLSVDVLTIQNAGTGFGPPGSTVVRKLTEHDLDIIESVNGVKIVVPRLIRVVGVEYNKERQFLYIADIPEEPEKMKFVYESLNIGVEEGKMLSSDDNGKVVLGNDFTKDSFGKSIEVGSTLVINGKDFEVAGILERASTFTVNSAILMLNDDLEDLLKINDEMDLIVAQVEDKDKINDVAEELELKLRKDRDEKIGEEDFSVQTPIQSLESINNILVIINLIVIGIATVSLLVGGIGIMNTMYTSVLERNKEIGIMKAIGAQNKDILSIFLIESGLLGLVGGVVGALMGLGLAFGVSKIAGIFLGEGGMKITISYPLLFGAIAFSLLIGIASGSLPAMQASKLRPVEALRK